jgi:hypothetical protein
MKKDKIKWGLYLPKEIYAELYRRQLSEHFSFLVACLLEEFLTRTDVSISREEMPTKTETVPSLPDVRKKEEEEMRERDREEVEEEVRERDRRKEEFLKRFEQFW